MKKKRKRQTGYGDLMRAIFKRSGNPGSESAREAGCTCPVLDNCHGAGYFGKHGVFVMSENCPLHGKIVKEAK